MARLGQAWNAAGHGKAGRGEARNKARLGMAWRGVERGAAGQGGARPGKARLDMEQGTGRGVLRANEHNNRSST